jgi:hypothetical protein
MTTSLCEIYEDAVKDRYLEQGLEQTQRLSNR